MKKILNFQPSYTGASTPFPRGGKAGVGASGCAKATSQTRAELTNPNFRRGEDRGPELHFRFFAPMTREEKFMHEAIALSRQGSQTGQGGPFGCVVVKGDEVIGRGCNQVLSTTDPTAHAEVVAIRDACKRLNSFQLTGCEVFTSCEPCPMCLGAIYWARPDKIYYANHRHDAAAIGFDDSLIYDECCTPLPARKIPMIGVGRQQALQVFNEWAATENKNVY